MVTTKIILFEDADIVFPDEDDFYLQLSKLVPNSKVPIIITASDEKTIVSKLVDPYFNKMHDDGFVVEQAANYIEHELLPISFTSPQHELRLSIIHALERCLSMQSVLKNDFLQTIDAPIMSTHQLQLSAYSSISSPSQINDCSKNQP